MVFRVQIARYRTYFGMFFICFFMKPKRPDHPMQVVQILMDIPAVYRFTHGSE